MIYFIWGILNIGLFIYFIVVCFKATKLIREELGLFSSIVFVLGLLSFLGQSYNNNIKKEPNSSSIKTWKYISEDSSKILDSNLISIELERIFVVQYDLGIKYGQDKLTQKNIPISAYSSAKGFISGTNWVPKSISINQTEDNYQFDYIVDGVVEWKLLGFIIYAQSKEYSGKAILK